MYTVSARHVGTTCCHEKADEVAAGPETRFRILCVGEGDAAGLPDEVRGTVRVREVEREKIDQTIPDCWIVPRTSLTCRLAHSQHSVTLRNPFGCEYPHRLPANISGKCISATYEHLTT